MGGNEKKNTGMINRHVRNEEVGNSERGEETEE